MEPVSTREERQLRQEVSRLVRFGDLLRSGYEPAQHLQTRLLGKLILVELSKSVHSLAGGKRTRETHKRRVASELIEVDEINERAEEIDRRLPAARIRVAPDA